MKALEICCWVLLGSTMPLIAATDDDDFPQGATLVSYDFAQWCQVGDHKFSFENTTLSDVIRSLGAGTIRRNGSPGAADYTYFVDYTNGHDLISFLSDSDMGGEKHELEGILIRPLSNQETHRKVPSLSLPIILPFGIPEPELTDLEKRLGLITIQKGRIYYEFKGKKPVKDIRGQINICDVTTTLRASIAKGKAVSIEIWHVTSD